MLKTEHHIKRAYLKICFSWSEVLRYGNTWNDNLTSVVCGTIYYNRLNCTWILVLIHWDHSSAIASLKAKKTKKSMTASIRQNGFFTTQKKIWNDWFLVRHTTPPGLVHLTKARFRHSFLSPKLPYWGKCGLISRVFYSSGENFVTPFKISSLSPDIFSPIRYIFNSPYLQKKGKTRKHLL